MSALSMSSVDNIMSCMFCEIITETLEKETTPTGVIQSMFNFFFVLF
uniref:Saposin B-type domain-containing protein n=1 Tax=Heterorhabditis bacteriophora TaxID=37862 RepID=A0A1I7W9P3_HETBA